MNKPRVMELVTGFFVDAKTYGRIRASLQQLLLRTGDEWLMNHSAVGQAYALLREERKAITNTLLIEILRQNKLFKNGSAETLTAQDVVDEDTKHIILASVQRVDEVMISKFSSTMLVTIPVYSVVENPVRPDTVANSVLLKPKGTHLRK